MQLTLCDGSSFSGSSSGSRLRHSSLAKGQRSQKADIIVLSDLVINGDTPIGKMVSRLGYTLVERSHVKKA